MLCFVFLCIRRRYLSRIIRKPAFRICEKTKAQISCTVARSRAADKPVYFRYRDSTIPLLPKIKISSLQTSSVAVQSGLCLRS